MTKESLIKIIDSYKQLSDKQNEYYKLGIDLFDFLEEYYNIISTLLDDIFTKEGNDLISWWIFEDVKKVIWEKDNTEINLEKIEDFAEYIIKNYL
jgi:hypothetical protein